ncbi:MAG: DUF5630 domain-containing protein [Coxiellaceae bacterium]|nr:MAG: DUF5630 domain-containing protein [Coxiellaceae bacterium]
MAERQPLAEFERLTQDEKELVQSLENMPEKPCIYTMQRLAPLKLIRLARNSAKLEAYCRYPEMDEVWRKLHQDLQQNDFIFEYTPLTVVPPLTYYDWMCGTVLFIRASQFQEYSQSFIEYLQAAEKYHYFPAYDRINTWARQQIEMASKEKPLAPQQIQQIVEHAKRAVTIHGAAGYILLAKTAWDIAQYYVRCGMDSQAVQGLIMTLAYCDAARQLAVKDEVALRNVYSMQPLNERAQYTLENIEQYWERLLQVLKVNEGHDKVVRAKEEAMKLIQASHPHIDFSNKAGLGFGKG